MSLSYFSTTAGVLAACLYMFVFVLVSRGQPDIFGQKTLVMSSPIPLQPSFSLRMNQIQVIGTHNSYHRELNSTEKETIKRLFPQPKDDVSTTYYSHASVFDQLNYQSVRSLEFDVWSDYEQGDLYANPRCQNETFGPLPTIPEMSKKGAKVFHQAMFDVRTICHTIVECLTQVREWSNAHPRHVPIPILIEFKEPWQALLKCDESTMNENWTAPHLDSLDTEIRSVFSGSQMIVPDDLRQDGLTLEQSVLKHGWPNLEDSRGKVFFVMDNEESSTNTVRREYRSNGRENLEGRVIFTNSKPGEPDAAFLKMNDPARNDQTPIRDLVAKGYWIRTRADADLEEVKTGNVTRREIALNSGAQIVSSDAPWPGMAVRWDSDYVVRLPEGSVARCNPINAPSHCEDDDLE